MIAAERYKSFPPRWGHLLVPTSSRRSALAGLALYSACGRKALLAQHAAYAAVRLLGPRALTGTTMAWTPPMGAESWNALVARWSADVGDIDTTAIYQRLGSREGLSALLLRRGTPVAFAKLGTNVERLRREQQALALVAGHRPATFVAPEPFVLGGIDGWHFLLTSALPARLHRAPVDPPLAAITREISAALAELPRGAAIPQHWRAMHGDFVPWNLRRIGRQLFLFDWEDASWGPPGADLALYQASEAVLAGRVAPVGAASEAAHFWADRVRARPTVVARDRRLNARLLQALGAGTLSG